MTREEAIDLLDNLIGMIEDNHESDYDTALKMAIKALEQEPCENAISRQAAIEAIYDNKDRLNIAQAIRELPPVTPQESKTGHWILSIEDWNKWTCSECGYSERTDIHVSLGYDYCPKCGVRMVESQESEEQK